MKIMVLPMLMTCFMMMMNDNADKHAGDDQDGDHHDDDE